MCQTLIILLLNFAGLCIADSRVASNSSNNCQWHYFLIFYDWPNSVWTSQKPEVSSRKKGYLPIAIFGFVLSRSIGWMLHFIMSQIILNPNFRTRSVWKILLHSWWWWWWWWLILTFWGLGAAHISPRSGPSPPGAPTARLYAGGRPKVEHASCACGHRGSHSVPMLKSFSLELRKGFEDESEVKAIEIKFDEIDGQSDWVMGHCHGSQAGQAWSEAPQCDACEGIFVFFAVWFPKASQSKTGTAFVIVKTGTILLKDWIRGFLGGGWSKFGIAGTEVCCRKLAGWGKGLVFVFTKNKRMVGGYLEEVFTPDHNNINNIFRNSPMYIYIYISLYMIDLWTTGSAGLESRQVAELLLSLKPFLSGKTDGMTRGSYNWRWWSFLGVKQLLWAIWRLWAWRENRQFDPWQEDLYFPSCCGI